MRKLALIGLLAFAASGHLLDAGPLVLRDAEASDRETSVPFHEIRGTGDRQNPVRIPLAEPFSGDTLFVRFRLRYDEASLDHPPGGDGEFFVFWLDRTEGNNASSHSGNVPNAGIHVDAEGRNRFMVRYRPQGESFGPQLEGGKEFTLVARLAKSKSGSEAAFDELSLWVDPDAKSPGAPDAVARDPGAIDTVSWVGFSTARKTEPGDRILVGDVVAGVTWEDVTGEAASTELTEIPDPPRYVPPPPPERIAEVDPQPDSLETDHWSFQPLRRPELPGPAELEGIPASWIRSPIDAFIAKAHLEKGLHPAPPADAETLSRRVSLVLTGLPPEAVVEPENLDRYIDACLDSQGYGERWGRHWLDVARWAESNGHQHNRIRDHAWRYRDWVVDAFRSDKPFDQFLREQIAGDELEPYAKENLVATGFLAASRYSGNELDKRIQRNDILVDIVNTTAKSFLGLTMECAQCHDHFFDPVTQWDYYRLMAFFAQGQPGDVFLAESDPDVAELVRQRWGLFESVRSRMIEKKRSAGVPEPVLVIPKSVPGGMTAAEKRAFAQIEAAISTVPKTWAFHSPVTSPHDLEFAPTTIRWPLPFQEDSLEHASVRYLDRGDVDSPGPVAEPAWPLVFGETPHDAVTDRPRLALADWLTDRANPLPARVWVNRVWQWHFGRGLVASSGDFGPAGDDPSHPELLDWLACELIDSGWSTRHVHRLILSSSTFRQGSSFSSSNAERDPGNRLLWRWTPRRLEAEAIRDSVLFVTGALDSRAGGPSVALSESETSHRRSLYLRQRRDDLPHQQALFDAANAVTSCSHRRTSTVALQPLWLLNSNFMQEQAERLAEQIDKEASPEDGPGSTARRLIRTVLQREATPEEIGELGSLIGSGGISDAALVLLNTNEFLYIP